MSVDPAIVDPLSINSTFDIDINVTDVIDLFSYSFILSYNPQVLSPIGTSSFSPFAYKWALADAENLPVNGFDNTRTGWTRVGTSPYLNLVDYPLNYIYQSAGGVEIGDFSFANLASPYLGGQVFVEINARSSDGDDAVEVWLYDEGSATWVLVDTLTAPLPPTWLATVDVSSILDTTAKINAAKVYLVKKTNGAQGEVRVVAMRLRIFQGVVAMAYSMPLGTTIGVSGDLPMASITFQVRADLGSPLDLSETKLASAEAVVLAHGVANGVYNPGAVPEFPFGIAIELSLILVIAYVWWKHRRKTRISKKIDRSHTSLH